MPLSSVEIFVGAGGLAIGAYNAGFRCSLMLDSSSRVCDSLRHNSGRRFAPMASADIVKADVCNFDFTSLTQKPDILLGGPPCQPFSQGGRRQQHSDRRNMFPEAIRALYETQPTAFLFENVKGLTVGQNRNYAELIRLQLQFPSTAVNLVNLPWEEQLAKLEDFATANAMTASEYTVIMHVLNAADFGVPQKRERVFFAGFKSDLGIKWHFPSPTHSKLALAISQSRNGTYWDRHRIPLLQRHIASFIVGEAKSEKLLPWQTTRDAISDLPQPLLHGSDENGVSQHTLILGAREYRGHTGSSLDQPSKALKAGVHGVPGGENMFRQSNGELRYFTIRECARLQTFPDEFEVFGPRSEQIRQLGNAVPCLLAEKVLRSMYEAIARR
jgi:DNA (cytosine-5)-methyltransferase 1